MSRIVAIANQKGGVGKSTTAINLAAYLSALGERVLVVDLDPQANATSGLGIVPKDGGDVYDVLLEDTPIHKVVLPTRIERLYIAPASVNLAGAKVDLVSVMAREYRLKQALEQVPEGGYERVLLDCPPSLDLLTVNALAAADEVLIPIQCEYYALEGLNQLRNTINEVQRHLNPQLEIGGVLLTMFDSRTNLAKEVAEEVRAFFGTKVFKEVIPRSVRLSEAPSFGLPVTMYAPKSSGAAAYEAVAREVLSRG